MILNQVAAGSKPRVSPPESGTFATQPLDFISYNPFFIFLKSDRAANDLMFLNTSSDPSAPLANAMHRMLRVNDSSAVNDSTAADRAQEDDSSASAKPTTQGKRLFSILLKVNAFC